MRLRKRIQSPDGAPTVVILNAPDEDGLAGKFVVDQTGPPRIERGGIAAPSFSVRFTRSLVTSISMQKPLSELSSLPKAELVRLFEREPLLVTQYGEPRFVAQSLDSFESMVRRLRQLESTVSFR